MSDEENYTTPKLHPMIKNIEWTPEPEPIDPHSVYVLPENHGVNIEDLVHSRPGGIIRCDSIPPFQVTTRRRCPLEADWSEIWSKATNG